MQLVETTIWQRWPHRYILVLYLACKRIFMCFPLSIGDLKLHFSYHNNGNWNISNCYNWLNIPLGSLNWLKIWMFYTLPTNSVETIPRYILVLYLLQRNLGEICVLHWVVNIWNCTFSYLYNGNWNFHMTTSCLILLWELGRDPWRWHLTRYILVLYLDAKEILTICVLHWVMDIWNYFLYNGNWNFQMTTTA